MATQLVTTIYFIPKMDCPTEEALIKNKLSGIKGIKHVECNLLQQEVSVTHGLADEIPIQTALLSLGMDYQQRTLTKSPQKWTKPVTPRWHWLAVGLSGVLALGAEIASYWLGKETSLFVFGLAFASILIGGRETFMKGLRALRNLNFNMNFLMAVAITGAFLIGEWPEAAMVTFLFTLAEMIEVHSLDKARHAIRQLMEITPDVAMVKDHAGNWSNQAINEIGLNAIVRVKPGERVPLDGIILEGQSSINQAPITGESMPVEKKAGDMVYAGSINTHGSFEFTVTVLPQDTVLAKILRALQDAQTERAPTQRFVDQFAKYYTPTMVLFAVLLIIIPTLFFGGNLHEWFYKALVLLVIACPCALVISTPVTIVSGLTAAAKHGMLIKGGSYLETGHRLQAIAFDKTGTLTQAKPSVIDIVPLAHLSSNDILHIAASLEAYSEHPIATAIMDAWIKNHPVHSLFPVTEFEAVPGRGVIGKIHQSTYRLGNHAFTEEYGLCTPAIEAILNDREQQGQTTVILCAADQALGMIAVADSLREHSRDAIQALHRLGLSTILLTGDNATTAHAIAKKLNIDDVRANLLPTDKLSAVHGLLKEYQVVGVVGDGINDAPALAKASIGFAMGTSGTDIALEAADVALMEDNLMKLPFFIRLSRATWRTLVQNISLAISIKIIFFTLALFGKTSLWVAIFADMGASLIVVFNGLRLLNITDTHEHAS